MKRIFFISISTLSFLITYSQNLVENPSFELTTSNCSSPFGEGFAELINWDQANVAGADSCSTSDLFSACNLNLGGMGGPTVMPNSQLGYQYSRTGTRHIGLITHEAGSGWREYAQGKTTTPLVAGQQYCVSLYVSLANACLFATNNIGIRFTQTRFERNACPGTTNSLINLPPQLNYTCTLTDTMNWVRIQWDYTAAGGENYFIIGNFFNNASTTIANVTPGGGGVSLPFPMAYYYIDDVSIVPNSCCFADINVPGSGVLCANSPAITLGVSAGLQSNCVAAPLNGVWSGVGITNTSTGVFNPAIAGPGIHTVSYTLPCGYVATSDIIVSPCNPLSFCQNGGNLVVSNGVGPYSWQQQVTTQDCSTCFPAFPPFIQPCSTPPGCAVTVTVWSTFATGTSIPIPASFPIQVIDTAGTIFTINSLASIPACVGCPTITVSSSNTTNVSCFNGTNGTSTVSAAGGTGGYTYVWQPGNLNGATQNNLAAGTYTVTATDANSCTGTTTVTITQPATALTLQTSSLPADCGQTNGSASVIASGGTGSYGYSWSPSGGNGSSTSPVGAGSYTVTVTDANNCTATSTIAVANTNGPIVALVSQQNVTCANGNNGSAEIIISQGTTPYNIAWTPVGGNGLIASNLTAGNYTATITDGGGCIATQVVTITEPAPIVLALTSQPTDCGFSTGSAEVIVSGGVSPLSFSWSPSGGSAAQASGLAGGSYTVTVTDFSNCTQTGSVAVDVTVIDSTLTVSTQSTPESCVGNDGTATALANNGNPPYEYSWSDGTITDSSFVSGLTEGTYTVTVTDECYSITQDVIVEAEFEIPVQILPNIITPNKDNVNDFLTVGTQFESTKDFYCYIYNRWGIAVHKTDNKSIMWVPKNITDGTYFIVVIYKDCTGKEEKLTSTITVAGSK